MAVPHRAHEMLVLLLFVPGIDGVGYEAEGSCRRVPADTGSMFSCPLCMAERTDRRESQFKDGARSRRTVGSLYTLSTENSMRIAECLNKTR
jgi:hypothetical protein